MFEEKHLNCTTLVIGGTLDAEDLRSWFRSGTKTPVLAQ